MSTARALSASASRREVRLRPPPTWRGARHRARLRPPRSRHRIDRRGPERCSSRVEVGRPRRRAAGRRPARFAARSESFRRARISTRVRKRTRLSALPLSPLGARAIVPHSRKHPLKEILVAVKKPTTARRALALACSQSSPRRPLTLSQRRRRRQTRRSPWSTVKDFSCRTRGPRQALALQGSKARCSSSSRPTAGLERLKRAHGEARADSRPRASPSSASTDVTRAGRHQATRRDNKLSSRSSRRRQQSGQNRRARHARGVIVEAPAR